MNTDTISPIERPEKMLEERQLCFRCKQRPRVMVFPPYGGSFLDVNCEKCAAAPEVLQRLESASPHLEKEIK